jgi:hypothetical protein
MSPVSTISTPVVVLRQPLRGIPLLQATVYEGLTNRTVFADGATVSEALKNLQTELGFPIWKDDGSAYDPSVPYYYKG